MLEGKTPIQKPVIKRGDASQDHDARFKAFEMLSHDSQTMFSSKFSQESMDQRGKSKDGPWADSSMSLSSRYDYSSSNKLLED